MVRPHFFYLFLICWNVQIWFKHVQTFWNSLKRFRDVWRCLVYFQIVRDLWSMSEPWIRSWFCPTGCSFASMAIEAGWQDSIVWNNALQVWIWSMQLKKKKTKLVSKCLKDFQVFSLKSSRSCFWQGTIARCAFFRFQRRCECSVMCSHHSWIAFRMNSVETCGNMWKHVETCGNMWKPFWSNFVQWQFLCYLVSLLPWHFHLLHCQRVQQWYHSCLLLQHQLHCQWEAPLWCPGCNSFSHVQSPVPSVP